MSGQTLCSCSSLKLVERLENLEKRSNCVDELKAELKATKGLLEDANTTIIDLKTELAITKKELAKLKGNLQPKENKEDRRPKENNQALQPKENKAGNEPGDLHSAYDKLPYDSLYELKTFTEELRVVETYNHLKNRLLCIGGAGVKEFITAVLNTIMTPNLQAQISLTGKKTTKPSLLKDYKQVANLIHDVVRSTNKEYTDKCGNEIIGNLLRNR